MDSQTSSDAPAVPPVVVSKAQIVSIITWFLLVSSSVAVLARLSIKWAVSKRFHLDDILALVALLCHVGSGIGVTIMDKNGLGNAVETLTESQRRNFGRSSLAADLLFIATLCFAKLSILFLLNLISQQDGHRRLSWILGIFISAWSLASFLAAAFSCKPPNTWDVFSKCYDRAAFWYTFGALNIVTDTALILLPMHITIPLQMSTYKKVLVLSCFGTRILDIGLVIAQMFYTSAFRSANFTAELWRWVLLSQFVQCITIITSCVPYLRPLLEAFPSGMFMSDEIRRKGSSVAPSDGYVRTPEHGYVLQNVSKDGVAVSQQVDKDDYLVADDRTGLRTLTVSDISTQPKERRGDNDTAVASSRGWSNGSTLSSSAILKTTTFSTS